jgi:hypothetical protein
MFRASIIRDDILRAVRDDAQTAPDRMRLQMGLVARGPIAQQLIKALSTEPPKHSGKVRWKSDKQRRFVLAKLRREGNLPYRRSHRLSRGWTVSLENLQEGDGILRIQNRERSVEFVQGDHTQPYHLDTGWPQAAVVIRQFEPRLEDEVINRWYKVVKA